MKQHFFISGLPRAGSTLLCNILAQNPKHFVSKATSGCPDVLFSIRNQWDKLIEHRAEGINHEQLRSTLSGAFNGYYCTDKEIIFDKSRGWLSILELLEFTLNRPAKIIVPVRNYTEILCSFENLWRATTGRVQWSTENVDYYKSQSLEGRCEVHSKHDQALGMAYNRVKDAIARNHGSKMYFMEMDNLTENPKEEMNCIYDFLGLERYDHDFDNVLSITKEDDINVHGIPDLHKTRSKVEPVAHRASSLLTPELLNKYNNMEFWRNLK
jgi:sulfotransferase